MAAKEDIILVNHLRLGNPKSFEKLFLKYHRKVYYFCYSILKNREDCEGLVQNIFSDIWENRERLDSTRSFYGYLFRIARNKIYNHLRKNLNEQVYREYIINSNNSSNNKTEADLDLSELSNIIEETISRLPPRRKEIFMLSRSEGLTYREIGKKLNISENTVDTQIRNALDLIRQELKKYI
jgi:RNA polymerase sigma-70 factor (ECF subfamily)